MTTFAIAGRQVGGNAPCLVIAEAGVNHNGRLDTALALIDAAAAAGADCVKFQTFLPEELVSPIAPKATYQSLAAPHESQLDMVRGLALPFDDFERLRDHANQQGLIFLSTPFDEPSLEQLNRLDVAALKVGSGDLTNLPFLIRVAESNRPLIVSTGMATLDEVRQAVEVLRQTSTNAAVALLHCVSSYPAAPADANLRAMSTLGSHFSVPIGYSDHSEGPTVAIAAVAMGASILEKHLTLDRGAAGPDHAASMEPNDFREMVAQIRVVESALGDGVKQPRPSEANVAAVARRSVVARRDLAAGSTLDASDLAIRRPGYGISPIDMPRVIGRRLLAPLNAGDLVRWEQLG